LAEHVVAVVPVVPVEQFPELPVFALGVFVEQAMATLPPVAGGVGGVLAEHPTGPLVPEPPTEVTAGAWNATVVKTTRPSMRDLDILSPSATRSAWSHLPTVASMSTELAIRSTFEPIFTTVSSSKSEASASSASHRDGSDPQAQARPRQPRLNAANWIA
jgi:hypothetical protein